ncbi:hypothetical protein [Protaetiibacter intestinalis]|uniref:Uncharacterized protein n=1 Tax=Protaetiibacter intestinalis TaxID=2419774 RepID=A0A387B3C7_9MICO|nr:hypothetical protein [Protaetiibacter intestinalis]AYF96913.1 hypothetical protein D7I47_00690 [Protaetiibacter intestinalis]
MLAAARKLATWLQTHRPSTPGPLLAREFDELHAAIGPPLDLAVRSAPVRGRPVAASSPTTTWMSGASAGLGLALFPVVLGAIGLIVSFLINATLAR